MTDDKEVKPAGKRYKGEKFTTVKTAEDMVADMELQASYEDEHAVPLNVYFALRGIRDPVRQVAMGAYTKVRRATVEAFDNIFITF